MRVLLGVSLIKSIPLNFSFSLPLIFFLPLHYEMPLFFHLLHQRILNSACVCSFASFPHTLNYFPIHHRALHAVWYVTTIIVLFVALRITRAVYGKVISFITVQTKFFVRSLFCRLHTKWLQPWQEKHFSGLTLSLILHLLFWFFWP